jgi:hypothetical protein
MEGQYYWSKEINDLLVAKLIERTGQDFEIVLVLADIRKLKFLTRQMSVYELRLLHKLQAAARFTGGKLTLGCPYVFPSSIDLAYDPTTRPKPIYIHSKVIIVDDHYLSIGSANLATRALRLDTEINLTLEAENKEEKRHIRDFSETLLSHWNIGAHKCNGEHDNVRLVPIEPARELNRHFYHLSPLNRWIQKRIPWKFFFDPYQPWLRPIARKLRKTSYSWIFFIWAFSALFTAGLTVLLAGSAGSSAWELGFALALGSVWLAPMPFVALALLSEFKIGPEMGLRLSVFSLWSASFTGYFLTRLFPTYFSRFFRETAPRWLPRRLGLRQFPATVSIAADPRLSLRSKIAYQGLYCVPFPWFFLNMILVLPAALSVSLRLAYRLVPVGVASKLYFYSPAVFTVLITYGIARLMVRSKSNP